MYRINFLTGWIAINIFYALLIETYAVNTNKDVVNDGSWGFLEVFAAYLAILVLYRVTFGGLHILKMKIKRNCLKKYKLQTFDLHQEFKNLRKADNWNESMVDNDFALLEAADEYKNDETLMDNSVANADSRRIKGLQNKMNQTCIDTDDDD